MDDPTDFDIVIVGGGPGGIAAACAAGESGKRVVLIDNNPELGGNIWRGSAKRREAAVKWLERFGKCGAHVIRGTVFAAEGKQLMVERDDRAAAVRFDKLILATGARELCLPFPGWTLPSVTGAAGLEALVKNGWQVRGKRVVVAGSGPLLLAAAEGLHAAGAKVLEIVEQAPLRKVASFAVEMLSWPEKALQAVGLQARLWGVGYRTGSWVTRAVGTTKLERARITNGNRVREVACDYLACGYGLVPNLELPTMLGCPIADGRVQVNNMMLATEDVYCAGEANGIGGVECALIEGEIAGYAAAGNREKAEEAATHRMRARVFGELLAKTFTLRDEVKQLAEDQTIACRCEDVTIGEMRRHDHWRAAKLHTRCGMGPCQGRICGAAAAVLFGWEGCDAGGRPPILPVRVESLAKRPGNAESSQDPSHADTGS